MSFSGNASLARALSLQLRLISLLMACMNNHGCAAEILISSIPSRETVHPPSTRVGRFGAYRVFLEYSYLSSAAVYSQGKPMPSLQSLAGTRGEDADHINALFVCWCALPSPPPPFILCHFMRGASRKVQRELYSIVYGVILHKQWSFNVV